MKDTTLTNGFTQTRMRCESPKPQAICNIVEHGGTLWNCANSRFVALDIRLGTASVEIE